MCPTIKNKVLYWLAFIIPYALIFTILTGLLITIIFQQYKNALFGLILGIPILAASILILKIQKKDADFSGSCLLFPFDQQLLIKIFFISFAISFIVALLGAVKSPLFLILIVFLSCIILLQIFSKNSLPDVVLTEIVLILMIYIYTTTLTYPYYFGGTDIIFHDFLATLTSLTGNIAPPNISEYSYFPLYHIWIASGSLITGFNSYTTIIILTCPVFAISAIFIYYLFYRIIKNQQIALLSCLLYSLSSVVLFYGTYVVTRTMAYIGLIVLLYLLYNQNVTEIHNQRLIFRSLAIVFSVYIILVHQVSTPMILSLFIIILVCEWMIARQKYMSTSFTLLIISIFISYWLFCAYSFSSLIITTRLNIEHFNTPSFIMSPLQYTPLFASYVFLINNIDSLIFLFFGFIGIIYLIGRKEHTYISVFGLIALTTIVFFIPNPLQSLWQALVLLQFDRFKLLISPFMALVMAWGIWVVIKYFSQKKIPVKIIIFIILSFFILYACSSFGLIQYKKNLSQRPAFTADELIGYNFIEKNIPSNSQIFSDFFSERYLQRKFFNHIIPDAPSLSSDHGYFVIPEKQFLAEGLLLSKGGELNPEGGQYPYLPTNENVHNLYHGLYSKNQIYSSNSLELYYG